MYFSNGKIQLKHTPAARKYFRKNSERAFAGRLSLSHPNPGVRKALGMHLVLGRDGWMKEKKEIFWKTPAGVRLGRDGWMR